MSLALTEARFALEAGEIPVGALIVKDDEVIASGRNRVEERRDPTAHAEILAIREAGELLDNWRLEGCSVFVTLEPCVMCMGAILNARINRLFFALHDPEKGAAGSAFNLGADPALRSSPMEIFAKLMEKEAQKLLENAWKKIRKSKRSCNTRKTGQQ